MSWNNLLKTTPPEITCDNNTLKLAWNYDKLHVEAKVCPDCIWWTGSTGPSGLYCRATGFDETEWPKWIYDSLMKKKLTTQ